MIHLVRYLADVVSEIETAECLLELLRERKIFATRGPDGQVRYIAVEYYAGQVILPLEEVCAELSAHLN